jgi:hypothetical protein
MAKIYYFWIIGELSESFSKYFRFLARKLYVLPHSGLESAISITFIYLFIIDDKLVCLYMMTHVKSTHLMIKMQTYLYMFMIYVLNIGTITFYYIANLTCIATWPKYTIFTTDFNKHDIDIFKNMRTT